MGGSMIWPLIIFCALQVATPGPANMVLLATGAGFGLRRALPFVCGVALGKQLLIWPLGLGLLAVAQTAPMVFTGLQYASIIYICYLAWRVAGMRFGDAHAQYAPPSFAAGLIVHPLNPKAWGMITAAFATFIPATSPPLTATLTVAVVLLAVQAVLHPIWAGAGQLIAARLKGTRAERPFFVILALLTVASVVFAFAGGSR